LSGLADQYGQFIRADWPGKVHQDADFQQQNTDERQWLSASMKIRSKGPRFSAMSWR
jgi:hypothetical protein